MTQKPVMSIWQMICFGVLTTPLALAGFAMVFFVPTFYGVDMGLGLALVGAIFACSRIVDVFTDPLIGHLSDQTRLRWGARLPWVLVGVPGLGLAAWALFMPPDGAGVLYLVVASTAFYLFYTVLDVPYSAIGLEISPSLHERSYLASSKAVFQVAGAIAAALIAAVLGGQLGGSLQLVWMVMAGLLALGLAVFVFFVPRPHRAVHLPRIGLWSGTRVVLANRRFRLLILAFFIVQAGNALTAALAQLYLTQVAQVPALFGPFLLTIFIATALCLPIWVLLSRRWSKKTSWMVACVAGGAALVFAAQIGAGQTVSVLVFGFVLGAVFGCDAIMPTSMLADLVYEGEAAGDQRRGATYLAVKNAVSKLTFVLPMGLAFPVLQWVGFGDAGGTGSAQIGVFLAFFAGVPILTRIAAIAILWRAPLSVDERPPAQGRAK